MLVLIALGILMGLPRILNTVSGWHKAVSWFLLPLLILSPLTGIFIATGVSMNVTAAPPIARTQPLPVAEAVRIIGQSQDLSRLIWLRQRGGRQMVRMWDGQEARAYAVTKEGLLPLQRNIARGIHEGNIFGIWTGIAMIITSLGFMLLMGTGLWLFFRKQYRKFQNKKARAARAAATNPAE